jgi:hypothetical protein
VVHEHTTEYVPANSRSIREGSSAIDDTARFGMPDTTRRQVSPPSALLKTPPTSVPVMVAPT